MWTFSSDVEKNEVGIDVSQFKFGERIVVDSILWWAKVYNRLI